MSYELSISRGFRYSDDDSFRAISEDEWNSFLELSDDYIPVSEAHGRNPKTGATVSIQLKDTAKHRSLGFYISFRDGCISTDLIEDLLPEYREIASGFDAQLFGEEGETY